MGRRYALGDYLHFGRILWRQRLRQRRWQKHFEQAVADKTFKLPSATSITVIPTEACNLRCPMCNQWGEKGYFLNGARHAQHMDPDDMRRLLRSLSPRESLLNIHGGEPFAYRDIAALLDELAERQFDVLITTNGTLMGRHIERLGRIENLALILSVDGDRETHDKVRGKGNFQRSQEGLDQLFEFRRRHRLPAPLVIMSFVVCEWTTDAIETAVDVARDLGVFALNYNLRYFMPQEAGEEYEEQLKQHFGVSSSGAWKGWISRSHIEHDYTPDAAALARVMRRTRFRVRPPYVFSLPGLKKQSEFQEYFSNYLEIFENESCFMPFYWARVHANGDLIYCPGHPDIICGNVFRDGFMEALNSERSIQLRKHILTRRFPICNRCCGLFMTYSARPQEQKARRKLGLPQKVSGFSSASPPPA